MLIAPLQEFLRVYDVLRNELLDDKLIKGQPAFAKEHLKRVRCFLLTLNESGLDSSGIYFADERCMAIKASA